MKLGASKFIVTSQGFKDPCKAKFDLIIVSFNFWHFFLYTYMRWSARPMFRRDFHWQRSLPDMSTDTISSVKIVFKQCLGRSHMWDSLILLFVWVYLLYLTILEARSRLKRLILQSKWELKLTLSEYVYGTLRNRDGKALWIKDSNLRYRHVLYVLWEIGCWYLLPLFGRFDV